MKNILLAITIASAGCATDGDAKTDNTTAAPAARRAESHEEKFAAADLDKNGKLSRAELEAAPLPGPMFAAHLAEIDTDHDGELTHEEIATAMQRHHGGSDAEHAKQFAALDVDRNGKLSRAELEAAPVQGPGPMLIAHFGEIDSDADGELTHDEIMTAMHVRHGGEQ